MENCQCVPRIMLLHATISMSQSSQRVLMAREIICAHIHRDPGIDLFWNKTNKQKKWKRLSNLKTKKKQKMTMKRNCTVIVHFHVFQGCVTLQRARCLKSENLLSANSSSSWYSSYVDIWQFLEFPASQRCSDSICNCSAPAINVTAKWEGRQKDVKGCAPASEDGLDVDALLVAFPSHHLHLIPPNSSPWRSSFCTKLTAHLKLSAFPLHPLVHGRLQITISGVPSFQHVRYSVRPPDEAS